VTPPDRPLTGRLDSRTPMTPNHTDGAFARDHQRRTLHGQLPQRQVDLTQSSNGGMDNGNPRTGWHHKLEAASACDAGLLTSGGTAIAHATL
jgi:hypothetical protein